MATKQVLLAALDRESGAFLACRCALYDSATPLLATAQSAGAARKDVDVDDVLRFLMGVTIAPARSDEQRERMIAPRDRGRRGIEPALTPSSFSLPAERP